MATRMQQRRGTAAQWISTNDGDGPILAIGEIGYESDTNKFKIGDGVNHWVDLSYFVDLETTIAGAPGLLNSLDELAAAIGDDPSFFTTVGTNLSAHTTATEDVHGIADTAELATKSYVAGAVSGATVDQSALAGDGISWNGSTEQFDVDNTVVRSSDLAELSQDAVNNALSAGNGITKSYDDAGNTITLSVDESVYQKRITGVSDSEIGHLDGVTSAIQTQINSKLASSTAATTYAPIAAPTFTGTVSGITKSMVGLGSVDNTSDANKQISDATQTALDLKAPLASPTFTGTVSGITKGMVGLGSVNNTSDADKPISTATNNALSDKAPLASPALTGSATAYNLTVNNDLTVSGNMTVSGTTTTVNTTNFTTADPLIYLGSGNNANLVDLGIVGSYNDGTYAHQGLAKDASAGKWKLFKGVTDEPTTTINFSQASLDALAVGALEASSLEVGSVTNTEIGYLDGVTSAIQTQLDAKISSTSAATIYAPLESPTFTGAVSGITKSMVGLANVNNTTDANKPVSTATQTALDLKADLASPTFTGTVTLPDNTIQQRHLGDDSVGTNEIGGLAVTTGKIADGAVTTGKIASGAVTKSMVGLGNVDNTSDAAKPISTATQTALDLKANNSEITELAQDAVNDVLTAGTGITKTYNDAANTLTVAVDTTTIQARVTGVSDTEIGYLDGVTSAIQTQINTKLSSSDASNTYQQKVTGVSDTEISYLDGVTGGIQNQIDLKAPIASPTFTGTVTGVTKSMVGLGSVDNTTDAGKPISTATQTALDLKAPIASPTFTGTVSGITKAMVGLSNVNDTSDAGKPISTATQTALDLKAPIASPTFTGTVSGITKSMVGLGSADNTSDAGKPISTATQTALDLKAPLASPALTGVPTAPTAAATTNTTQVATTAYVRGEIAALVNSAGSTLDTLGEIATALGNDANLSTTLTTSIGLKAPLASPTFTGTVTIPAGASISGFATLASPTFTGTVTIPTGAALGTPASATLTNATGLPVATGISGLGTGVATFLATPSSANLASVLTDEIGTGNVVLSDLATSAQTASYTLVLADKSKLVEMSNASANTVTIPLNSSVAFPVGTQITILQTGAGATSVAVSAGVTLNCAPQISANAAKLRAQWSSITLIKRATDTWVAVGDLTAS